MAFYSVKGNISMNELQLFLQLYFYELELSLNDRSQELLELSFQSDEANTDRSLKEYLKHFIENGCNRLQQLVPVQEVLVEKEDGQTVSYEVTD